MTVFGILLIGFAISFEMTNLLWICNVKMLNYQIPVMCVIGLSSIAISLSLIIQMPTICENIAMFGGFLMGLMASIIISICQEPRKV